MVAFQAVDPGSTPGRRTLFFSIGLFYCGTPQSTLIMVDVYDIVMKNFDKKVKCDARHLKKSLMLNSPISVLSLWRNRLARSAVNRKVGGSSPPRDDSVFLVAPISATYGQYVLAMK